MLDALEASGGLLLTQGLPATIAYVALTSPAAGANAPYTGEQAYAFAVLAARATVSTDANAANRLVSLDFMRGPAATVVRNGAGVVLTANTTSQAFEWNAGRTVAEWASNTPVFAPVFPLVMPPGFIVQFTIDNKQVGDTLTGLSLVLARWVPMPGDT